MTDWHLTDRYRGTLTTIHQSWLTYVDALSYDFDPLQGLALSGSGNVTPGPNWDTTSKAKPQAQQRAARISALEVAIRAQSKRFLAHPLVVQQLEAIWAGTIVFHSAADSLHRSPTKATPNQNRGYGTHGGVRPVLHASPNELQPAKQRDHRQPTVFTVRRSVTLYDPRDASLFKLSRLRVPRYRQFLSTCSLAALLGLYLAVLIERSLSITPLEVVFWFWSAGFMLDEVVGFNEQGFSLYILSFWNTFDVGILLLLVCYYCLRLYGILMPDVRKHAMADMAYDVLAADAVLLFPRLFSVLDHYRYFSQLLIAFRMMAEDLIAVFILIVISCSGFFVAFTLSFGDPDTYDAPGVAYALFQILMGFTPAAWSSWPHYNLLGKVILTIFLFICHFLIVTILITVLTNSFMAIVQNANEEHQFVFAVNTISMVKSDALFSYVAPTNIIAWLLAPLRYVVPFREFVRINRTVIKATHFLILFLIYTYERLILRGPPLDLTDVVEQRGRRAGEGEAGDILGSGLRVFSPQQARLREPSVATFRKDRALEEVFRRPFRGETVRNTQRSEARRQTSNVVNGWMRGMGPSGTASPPPEQDPLVIDRLETRRLAHRRSRGAIQRRQRRDLTEATLSIASDPEDFGNGSVRPLRSLRRQDSSLPPMSINEPTQTEAGEGDDELATNDDDELTDAGRLASHINPEPEPPLTRTEDYFQQTLRPRPPIQRASTSRSSHKNKPVIKEAPQIKALINPDRPPRHHLRNLSTNTILYDPQPQAHDLEDSIRQMSSTNKNDIRNTVSASPSSAGRKTPKRNPIENATRPRPILPPRTTFQSAPNVAGLLMLNSDRDRQSSLAMDLGSDLGDNKAVGGGFIGGVPASLATQMAFAQGAMRARKPPNQASNDDQQRMSKLVLARMNTLEEGFREVLQEVRDWKREKDPGRESRSMDNSRSADMKMARRRSKQGPRKPWKGKGNGRSTCEDEEDWRDVDDSGELREKGTSI